MMIFDQPRGVRNNNPGNIDKTSIAWQGMSDYQDDPRFVVFTSAVYGIRALAKILLNYQNIDGLVTMREIIDRWAPPVENDVSAYVDDVSQKTGLYPDHAVDLSNVSTLTVVVNAIIAHECDNYVYPPSVIEQGISLSEN
jgi:hypothetical protein